MVTAAKPLTVAEARANLDAACVALALAHGRAHVSRCDRKMREAIDALIAAAKREALEEAAVVAMPGGAS